MTFSHFNTFNKKDYDDLILTLEGIDWEIYIQLLEIIGEVSWCKISYLNGVLEVVVTGERHETINRRFKEWKILHDIYRHSEHTHGAVFRAICTIVQMDINHGKNLW